MKKFIAVFMILFLIAFSFISYDYSQSDVISVDGTIQIDSLVAIDKVKYEKQINKEQIKFNLLTGIEMPGRNALTITVISTIKMNDNIIIGMGKGFKCNEYMLKTRFIS